jgi:hypothetical protein
MVQIKEPAMMDSGPDRKGRFRGFVLADESNRAVFGHDPWMAVHLLSCLPVDF